MTNEENIFYAKRNIVDNVYCTARLDGIAVTYTETREIYEGRCVPRLTVDEIVKINNIKHAWQFMLETIDSPMDLRYIQQINYKIEAGIIPNMTILHGVDLGIDETSWMSDIPNHTDVEKRIHEIMSIPDITERATTLMLYLMKAQLFMDGNISVAQIAANQIMIQNGAGIIRIPVEKQSQLLEEISHYYETGDMKLIKAFVEEGCLDGYEARPIEGNEGLDKSIFYSC